MLFMFNVGVVFCIMVYYLYYLFNVNVKQYLHKWFDDDNKRIVYDGWVERIKNCNDPKLLHQWQFEDHGKETDIWEFVTGWGDAALWMVCHDRKVEIYATREEEKVQRAINRKTWLIEG